MDATKQIKIRLEKHELKVVRVGRRQKFFCEHCRTETQHLTLAQISALLEISEMNVFRLVESEKIHWLETADGELMICADSNRKNRGVLENF